MFTFTAFFRQSLSRAIYEDIYVTGIHYTNTTLKKKVQKVSTHKLRQMKLIIQLWQKNVTVKMEDEMVCLRKSLSCTQTLQVREDLVPTI